MLALLTAGAGWGAYQAGLLDDLLGRRRAGDSTVADAGTPDTTPRTPAGEAGAAAEAGAAEAGAAEAGAAEAGAAEAGAAEAGAGAAAEAGAAEAGIASTGPTEADSTPDAETGGGDPTNTGGAPDATTGGPTAVDPTGVPDGPNETRGPDEPADDGEPDRPPTSGGEPEPLPGPGPELSPDEQKLSTAVDQRRVFMLKTLFATRRQGDETTFAGAWLRCAKLDVDGVQGWRLPHRREMKLVNAVLSLPPGVYWTRTVPPEDKTSAFVLDTDDASLALFLKEEPNGDVVCVRKRAHPEK
jgi:hypothetical protein